MSIFENNMFNAFFNMMNALNAVQERKEDTKEPEPEPEPEETTIEVTIDGDPVHFDNKEDVERANTSIDEMTKMLSGICCFDEEYCNDIVKDLEKTKSEILNIYNKSHSESQKELASEESCLNDTEDTTQSYDEEEDTTQSYYDEEDPAQYVANAYIEECTSNFKDMPLEKQKRIISILADYTDWLCSLEKC